MALPLSEPLLEILSDRYTIQATEVRKKQKLHVTVLKIG